MTSQTQPEADDLIVHLKIRFTQQASPAVACPIPFSHEFSDLSNLLGPGPAAVLSWGTPKWA